MSSASKSKSKDKKAGKEPSKAYSKPIHVASGGGAAASGYNPLLGTFHSIETATASSPALQVIGRYRNIEEADDHAGNSLSRGVDYDSSSNNGSWSGESEDHKDKVCNHPVRQETVPGADNDKREKIRQKNEKKHQRQKEKRTQELHERCSGYLMSRKLEALAQQLVGMGFPQERATMALILNEGKVEQSVAWLFEGGEEGEKGSEPNFDNGNSLKIDISEELARMAEMEIRCNCSRQDVERAVVASEGDLEKAEESLGALKEDIPSVPSRQEESGDPPTLGNGKLTLASNPNLMRMPQKAAATSIQYQRNERDLNYTKLAVTAGSPVDSMSQNPVSLERMQSKLEWAKAQQIRMPEEKRWPVAASTTSASISLSPALQASPRPAKVEAHFVGIGNGQKSQPLGPLREPVTVMQRQQPLGHIREPVTVMQRPQLVNGKMGPSTSVSSSSVGTVTSWYPDTVETLKSNGFVPPVSATRNLTPANVGTNQLYNQFSAQPSQPETRNLTPANMGTNQVYNQFSAQPSQPETRNLTPANVGTNQVYNQFSAQPSQPFVSSSAPMESLGITQGNGLWSRTSASPAISAASSLGLFSGVGGNVSSGSSLPLDWNSGSTMAHFDYNSIDWSLDRGPSMSRPSAMQIGRNGFMQHETCVYDSFSSGLGVKSAMRRVLSNGSSGGLQDGVVPSETSSMKGSREWSSPFEERDLFSLPRQFVSSPSL